MSKKSTSILFYMKIKMIGWWMQNEGTKLTFIMNFSVLVYSSFASRMPQIAQIVVFDFQHFPRGMPPDPLEISFFLSWAISASEIDK